VLREQGLFSMTQLLFLDPVEQLELHHVLQVNELSLTLRENVPLTVSLQALGLQAPASVAQALESVGFASMDDLLTVETAAKRELLCEELRSFEISGELIEYVKEFHPDGHTQLEQESAHQTKLSIGDRRAVIGLTLLGPL
jgi:DNA-binding transcriptional regulator YdaS (Cro superfamily)